MGEKGCYFGLYGVSKGQQGSDALKVLDGVGPVDNRPSSKKLLPCVKKINRKKLCHYDR